MAETIYYGESQLMFDDVEIVCDSFKITFKRDNDDLTATNSSTPYGTQFGKETIEAEASDIDPALRKVLKRHWERKTRATLASYDFEEDTGDLIEDDVLYNAYIKEISKENANKPFSIKIGATGYKKQN